MMMMTTTTTTMMMMAMMMMKKPDLSPIWTKPELLAASETTQTQHDLKLDSKETTTWNTSVGSGKSVHEAVF